MASEEVKCGVGSEAGSGGVEWGLGRWSEEWSGGV